ncbi:putative transmembrane protein [Trypanosoma grayi]|uniref:putative transmembrane protein n=1 Tax=Trypanosoma grayi TaxID=71804 RepID=UPI0004F451A5|nr:putative transmembrane protein [Trypanosoma grayi]KEG14855.1 putative transmembrane protein [Trypanosoma grayi]
MASPAAAGTLAVLLPLGGFIGYSRKGSIMSLAAGTVTGAIMAYSLVYLLSDPHDKWGNRIAAVTTLLLAAVMGARYAKGRKSASLIVSVMSGLSFLLAFGPNAY